MIATRSARRWANGAGVAIIAGLMGYAAHAPHILVPRCPLRLSAYDPLRLVVLAALRCRARRRRCALLRGAGALALRRHGIRVALRCDRRRPKCVCGRLRYILTPSLLEGLRGSTRLRECAEVNCRGRLSIPLGVRMVRLPRALPGFPRSVSASPSASSLRRPCSTHAAGLAPLPPLKGARTRSPILSATRSRVWCSALSLIGDAWLPRDSSAHKFVPEWTSMVVAGLSAAGRNWPDWRLPPSLRPMPPAA